MMYRALRNALLCAAVLASCAREAAEEKEAGKTRKLSTAEVMAQVAKAAYQPPADGRLTEEQVRRYLEVKRRARQGRTAEPPVAGAEKPGAEEPSNAADLRAALELGYNPKEIGWVQERVQEAWIALRGQELDRKIAESRNQMIRELETRLQSATDPKQKVELEKQIAEIRAAAPATAAPPPLEHNAELVGRYETEVARAFSDDRGPQENRHEG
jgi:hypothetical protein